MLQTSEKQAGCLHPQLCNGQEIQLKKNSQVFGEGEALECFYVVKFGACLLKQSAANGTEQIHRIVGPGDIIGKRAFFTGEGTISSASSLTELTLVVYTANELMGFMKTDPALCREIMAELMQDAYRTQEEDPIYNVHLSITQRLAALLQYLANKFGTNTENELKLQLKRQEMAAVLGTSPEYITNLLSRFQSWGVIKEYKNRIQLNALGDLQSMIDG
jgi:CRP-like cAMP-binding protein